MHLLNVSGVTAPFTVFLFADPYTNFKRSLLLLSIISIQYSNYSKYFIRIGIFWERNSECNN